MPLPTPISRIQPHTLESIGAQKQNRNSLRSVPVVAKRLDTVVYTEQHIDELYQIAGKFMNGSISMEEAILKLRGGGRLEDIS